MSDCQVCRATTTDAFLCEPCGRQLERALGDMPALVVELEITATKQDKIASGGKRGKGDESPLPFNWSASDQLWALWNTLGTWARHLAESRAVACPLRPDLLAWLLGAVTSIRMDEAAAQIHDEILYAHKQAQRMIDRPEPDLYAGRCDAADVRVSAENGQLRPTVSSCGAELYARLGDAVVNCHSCGVQYDMADRKRDLLGRVDDEWARPHVIANALTSLDEPITPDTLRKWIERGHVRQVGIDDQGKPLYRVGDVRDRIALIRLAKAERLTA